MSRRGDIRMYVEHLFEGRTLTKETIELKEEIYGNLTARYDDYIAQGVDPDEAYRRTCEAVTSLDDMLEDGERDDGGDAGPQAAGDAADADNKDSEAWAADADATVVAPASAESGPVPPSVTETAPTSGTSGRRRWSTGAKVAVVVGAVVLVALVGSALFGMTQPLDVRQTSDEATEVITPVGDTTSAPNSTPTATEDTTTGNGNANGNGNATGAQDGTGNGHGTGSQGLDAEIYGHSVDSLASFSGMSLSDSSRVAELVASLPLGSYATEVNIDAPSGTVSVTYTYQDRDQLAYDDDCVDRALVYDAAALLATMPDASTVEMIEVEDDGHDYDRDRQVFERATVEGILGISLDADLLTEDVWGATRDQLMTKRYWDPIWESAERD